MYEIYAETLVDSDVDVDDLTRFRMVLTQRGVGDAVQVTMETQGMGNPINPDRVFLKTLRTDDEGDARVTWPELVSGYAALLRASGAVKVPDREVSPGTPDRLSSDGTEDAARLVEMIAEDLVELREAVDAAYGRETGIGGRTSLDVFRTGMLQVISMAASQPSGTTPPPAPAEITPTATISGQ